MPTPRLRRAIHALVVLALTIAALGAAPADGGPPSWAPADEATVHPGVQTITAGGQCTANFVFHDATHVYLGQAAHCAGTGSSTDTDGCGVGSMPLGTEVEIVGATRPGTLAYSSWLTMAQVGESDPDVCAYNDFALVRLHPDDHGRVNPSLPVFGGPTAVGADSSFGDRVYTYGNSSLRGGISVLSPKRGVSLGQAGGGWTHQVYTLTPGVPGDSGSAVLGPEGEALGVLVTLQIAPLAGANGVTDLGRALAYANTHSTLDVELALGTEPFSPGQLLGLA